MNKFILLYITFILSFLSFYSVIEDWGIKSIQTQKNILIKQAQIHFEGQVNTREWISKYAGIYVRPLKGQQPNPYLKDNILKVNDKLTLIKVNPAWMTREISEQSTIKDFAFKITSLTPINPKNKATAFEEKALTYFTKSARDTYYEFEDNNFNFMGALVTTKSCLPCHAHQGYKLGDIRGGISIKLSAKEFNALKKSIQNKALSAQILVFLFLLSITLLIRQQFTNATSLEETVETRTKEVDTTKKLLQSILDNDDSLILVSDGEKIIFANKTLLNFVNLTKLDELQSNKEKISDRFTKIDDPEFLHAKMEGMSWITYLQQGHHHSRLKVAIRENRQDYYFSIKTKDILIENKLHQIITFHAIVEKDSPLF